MACKTCSHSTQSAMVKLSIKCTTHCVQLASPSKLPQLHWKFGDEASIPLVIDTTVGQIPCTHKILQIIKIVLDRLFVHGSATYLSYLSLLQRRLRAREDMRSWEESSRNPIHACTRASYTSHAPRPFLHVHSHDVCILGGVVHNMLLNYCLLSREQLIITTRSNWSRLKSSTN